MPDPPSPSADNPMLARWNDAIENLAKARRQMLVLLQLATHCWFEGDGGLRPAGKKTRAGTWA